MDGPEIPSYPDYTKQFARLIRTSEVIDYERYTPKFEHLGLLNGEVVALFSQPSFNGKLGANTEKETLDMYKQAAVHNAQRSDELKWFSNYVMDVKQQARAAIQDYKKRHSIPFDTPPVDQPVNIAANEPVIHPDC